MLKTVTLKLFFILVTPTALTSIQNNKDVSSDEQFENELQNLLDESANKEEVERTTKSLKEQKDKLEKMNDQVLKAKTMLLNRLQISEQEALQAVAERVMAGEGQLQ